MSINHVTGLRVLFDWQDQKKNQELPAPAALSGLLSQRLSSSGGDAFSLTHDEAALFATAAIDMWGRAVHSLLISVAVTDVSPIWSLVSGYYSSHYSIRALAHTLGYFQLFSAGKIAELELQGTKPVCLFSAKTRVDREHKFYARAVHSYSHFSTDPCFANAKASPGWITEVSTRDRANYIDHLHEYPTFSPLDADRIMGRVQSITAFDLSKPPEIRAGSLKLETVQILAYQRLVRLRQHLDAFVTIDCKFWKKNRTPDWASTFLTFQAPTDEGLSTLRPMLDN